MFSLLEDNPVRYDIIFYANIKPIISSLIISQNKCNLLRLTENTFVRNEKMKEQEWNFEYIYKVEDSFLQLSVVCFCNKHE